MTPLFDQEFSGEDFTNEAPATDFENCTFVSCNFAGANLNGYRFTDCTFSACNLSGIGGTDAAFRNVSFTDCKLLGFPVAYFRSIGLELSFDHCNLQHALFFGVKLPKTRFVSCELSDADLSEAVLTGSSFSGTNLVNTKFDRTNLEKCDFRGAKGLAIHPVSNKLKGAHFSADQLEGLVAHLGIRIHD